MDEAYPNAMRLAREAGIEIDPADAKEAARRAEEIRREQAPQPPAPSLATEPPPLAVLWYATLGDVTPQSQIVKGLLIAGSLFLVVGESNSGKTFFLLDLAMAIAQGTTWRGRRTRRGLVLYVPLEGAASVRARLAAYRKENPGLNPPFGLVSQTVNFLSAESVDGLIQTIKAAESETGEAVSLVIIDTFARAIPGGNENDAMDVGVAVSQADRVRAETGAAVGFIHHTGKDPSKGARGSSALRAAIDTEILIEGVSGTRTATATKQRDLEIGEPMPFDLVPVQIGIDPDDHQAVTSCVVKHLRPSDAPATPTNTLLRGKAQRQFVTELRERSRPDPDRIWRLDELRAVGRDIGMSKGTARSVADTIAMSPYMKTSVGGYRFTDGRVEG